MLSHETIVGDASPRSRRRARASATRPNTLHLAGIDVLDVVAALGDGQRDDPGGRRGQQFDDGLGVVGGVAVVDDRPDHARVAAAVGVLEHQRVQPVLGVHDLVHLAVGGHDADAADAPLAGAALLQQPVDVHGLVRTVEAADPEMHDADADFVAVVVGLLIGICASVELFSFMTPPPPS